MKLILTLLFTITISISNLSFGQGVSFSYLIPKNGYISAPVSPFSLRGVGLSFGDYLGLETGGTLYYMSGLGMTDLPFEYDKPLTGPNFSVLVPMQLYIKIPLKGVDIKFLGGGFAIWHLNPRINYGNMDRAIREFEGWDIVNSEFEEDFQIGGGIMGGIGFEFYVSKEFSITLDVQYLKGGSTVDLVGSYSGGDIGGTIASRAADFSEASVLLEGLEISIGANF
ncbi:MAG: hypothetical protein NXI20_01870 [bacterium]|nr:hypothetical protein [bacterium]